MDDKDNMGPARRGVILLAHGSRDPRWRDPFERLAAKIKAKSPETAVSPAFLKDSEPDIYTVAEEMARTGVTDVTVVPVFLAMGGHSANDFPVMAKRVSAEQPGVTFKWIDVIGSWDEVVEALATAIAGRALGV
jgi:sirohydrochlorin cobaltochelatase